jgi:circadian clock protein KaiC
MSEQGEGDMDAGEQGGGKGFIQTGIEGVDELFVEGIPKYSVNLIVGSPGSGKSIFGLQSLVHAAENGDDCLYLSLEESEESLRRHMNDFGWDPETLVDEGNLSVQTYDAFEMADAVENWLRRIEHDKNPFGASSKPKLFEDIEEADPDRLVLDSISAIEYAFQEQNKYYRHYISQLFNFFKEQQIDAFIIIETQTLPKKITANGQAEFLADGVFLLHRVQNSRGLEIYKMRGAGFQEKIAPMTIEQGAGIVVRPDERSFSDKLDKMKEGRRF